MRAATASRALLQRQGSGKSSGGPYSGSDESTDGVSRFPCGTALEPVVPDSRKAFGPDVESGEVTDFNAASF